MARIINPKDLYTETQYILDFKFENKLRIKLQANKLQLFLLQVLDAHDIINPNRPFFADYE